MFPKLFRPLSMRTRLTLWYSLALAAALFLFAGALWLSMWRSLHQNITSTLTERMRSTETFLRDELADPNVDLPRELAEYSQAFPFGTFIQITGVREFPSYTSNPAFPWSRVTGAPPASGKLSWRGQSFQFLQRSLTIHHAPWRVTFAVSLRSVDDLLARLRWLIFALAPLVVLLDPLAGAWLSRRALRPVDQITAAARQIGIQNLSERLDVPPTGDELERLASTWNSMLSRLEDAVLRLSRFTSDASHELRTPLAVIRATAEIALRKSRSPESYRSALEQVVRESERLTALIEDLLFLARCDNQDFDLPKEQLSLSDLIHEVYSTMHPVAEAHGVRLLITLAQNTSIVGNPSAIRRLFLILVDNAVKYCAPGGLVDLTAHVEDNLVRFSVKDQGPGIPQQELPFVFQRFYRGADARVHPSSGFGLGLALAQGIAELHRSRIEVSSTPGRGSVFSVVFPRASVS